MEQITPLQEIVSKLQMLPPQHLYTVTHFIDYLRAHPDESNERLTEDFLRLSTEVWDND